MLFTYQPNAIIDYCVILLFVIIRFILHSSRSYFRIGCSDHASRYDKIKRGYMTELMKKITRQLLNGKWEDWMQITELHIVKYAHINSTIFKCLTFDIWKENLGMFPTTAIYSLLTCHDVLHDGIYKQNLKKSYLCKSYWVLYEEITFW